MRGKIALLAAAMGLLFTLGAGTAQADHRARERQCWNRINKEEHKLEQAIRRHGWYSRQAQQRRTKLRRLHSQCGFSFRNRGLYDFGFWNRGRDHGRGYGWRGDARDRDRDRWRDRNRRDNDRLRDRNRRDNDRRRDRRRDDRRGRRP